MLTAFEWQYKQNNIRLLWNDTFNNQSIDVTNYKNHYNTRKIAVAISHLWWWSGSIPATETGTLHKLEEFVLQVQKYISAQLAATH